MAMHEFRILTQNKAITDGRFLLADSLEMSVLFIG
jgi:hypothetical protein